MLGSEAIYGIRCKYLVLGKCSCGITELIGDVAAVVVAKERGGDVDYGDVFREEIMAKDVESAGRSKVGAVNGGDVCFFRRKIVFLLVLARFRFVDAFCDNDLISLIKR